MRKYSRIALFIPVILLAIVPAAQAQSDLLDLPRDSQRAEVGQRIGITSITIRYHRPLVKGRKVFGGVVPYGEVWRAGANENTIIEFGDAATVEGRPLAKGVYGLHMIPGESEWTVIFSKNSISWGSRSYDQAEDALRVTVKSRPGEMHEALTFDFDDPKPNAVSVVMCWDKIAVPFKVEVNTPEIVAQSLRDQLRGRGRASLEWQPWDEAAIYLTDNRLNPEEALKYANQSIQIEERFENLITKARILDTLNRKDEATSARNRALELGTAMQLNMYGRRLQLRGRQEEAFAVFRNNIKKFPNHWVVHSEVARLACAKGDFDAAVKEMKVAAAGADDDNRPGLEALVKRLENKEDINK
jgi:tetratricopeptide (TPR) repeat protein